MRLPKWAIAVVCSTAIAALTATVVVQQRALSELRDANQALLIRTGQLATLQAENERLSNLLANVNYTSSLTENQQRDLARLRAEVGHLRTQGDEATQLQEENRKIRAQLAIPVADLLQNRALERQDQCISNLGVIQAAKTQWAADNQKLPADKPRMTDILKYLPNSDYPACPDGGMYILGAVGDNVRCNIPGHQLP